MAGVRDYAKLAVDIRDAVGEENIISATHCATRLRLVLKQSPADSVTKKISSMAGVIQVVEKGGAVSGCYRHACKRRLRGTYKSYKT